MSRMLGYRELPAVQMQLLKVGVEESNPNLDPNPSSNPSPSPNPNPNPQP